MRKLSYLFLLFLTFILFCCKKDEKTNEVPNTPESIIANLKGIIYNENNLPAQGVSVNVGVKTATTDAQGAFYIQNASLDKKASLVIAEKSGYFKTFRSFGAIAGTNEVVIKLTRKVLAGTIDAGSGGTVSLSNGSKIAFSGNSFMKLKDNSSYSGTVNVYAAYIDPSKTDFNQTVPGSLSGNDKNGNSVGLSSYGTLAVELESNTNAEPLQLKKGTTAEITIAIPGSQANLAPGSIPLWYLDEKTGLWKEEGQASKQGNYYKGNVSHFTYWSCNYPFATVNLAFVLKDSVGNILTNFEVTVTIVGDSAYSSIGTTDSLGGVNGAVPAGQNLLLKIRGPLWAPCNNVIYSQTLPPLSQNLNLGTITISSSAFRRVSINGHLSNCNGGNVSGGYVRVDDLPGYLYYLADASGNFNFSLNVCSMTQPIRITPVDPSSQQQGPTVTVPFNNNNVNINTGILPACGTSSKEFYNYTLDGVSYTINSNAPNQNIFSDGIGWWSGYWDVGLVGNDQIHFLNLRFRMPQQLLPGSYPVLALGINSTNQFTNTLVNPFYVTVTKAANIGEYWEGSFAGQFKDSNNVLHTISCNFRVQRRSIVM